MEYESQNISLIMSILRHTREYFLDYIDKMSNFVV